MTLKKSKNPNNTNHSSFSQFRTIIKSRINKQTVKEVVKNSIALQEKIQLRDNVSVKSASQYSKHSQSETRANQNLKNFVRNMKKNNLINQKNTSCNLKNQTIKTYQKAKSFRSSVYSTRSNKSIGNRNMVTQKQASYLEQDNKSVVSSKSMSKSQYFFNSRAQTMHEQQKSQIKGKLYRMQQKLDYLIRNKLKNLNQKTRSKQRYNPRSILGNTSQHMIKSINFTQSYQDQVQSSILNKQIEQILESIKNLKNKDSQKNISSQEIQIEAQQLERKIEILQKLIASSFTQSQILKKFYFSKKSQKYPYLNRKQRILQQLSKRKDMLQKNHSLNDQKRQKQKTPVLQYESSSKYFYKKPSKKDYNNQFRRLNSFTSNRQPLPRSVYNRQYLNYGTLPVFNYKPHDNNYSSSKLNIKTSNYQQAFKQKNIKMTQINHKDLDCFKNKIKFGNISFSQMMKQNVNKNKKQNIRNLQKTQEILKKQKNQNTSHFHDNKMANKNLNQFEKRLEKNQNITRKLMGETQMKREFVWYNTPSRKSGLIEPFNPHEKKQNVQQLTIKQAKIKNQRLNNLKANYSMQFLR